MGAGTARALSVSTRIVDLLTPRQDAPGRIHSVYARTLNVLFGDRRLVCIHPGPVMVSPFSVRIDAWPAGFPRALTPGLPVAVHGSRLRSGPLTVALEDARPWRPDIAGHPAPAPSVAVDLPVGLLRRLLPPGRARGPAAPPSAPGRLRVEEIILWASHDLSRAVRTGDGAAFLSAAGRLFGLGPGLTPSGDDFLVGFLGLIVAAGGPEAAWVLCLRRPLLQAAGELTTDLSRAFLEAALDGAFAEPVGGLLAALMGDAPPAVMIARAEALLGLGHSSGADTLAGVICAADARCAARADALGPVGAR